MIKAMLIILRIAFLYAAQYRAARFSPGDYYFFPRAISTGDCYFLTRELFSRAAGRIDSY